MNHLPRTAPFPGSTSGPGPSRRGLLTAALTASTFGGVALVAPAGAATGGTSGTAATATGSATGTRRVLGPLSVRGADISFLVQEEAVGNRFTDRGRVGPADQLVAAHGANWVRLRIWTNPPAGYSTLTSALALARRAKRLGMKILVDPHYSDFWADPQGQPIPAGWPAGDLTALAAKVRTYTRDVVRAFARQGTPVDMIQIGDEVTKGMLWPLGALYRLQGTTWTTHWPEFATLVKAGISGAIEGGGEHRPRIMVHIDGGGDNGASRYFFDHLFAQGVDADVIGLSYYAMWHGSLADLTANLDDLAARYDKDLVVAQTQYPWTLDNGDQLGNFVWAGTALPDGALYPATPAGQAGYYEALRGVLAAVPNGRGAGFLVWEPEWIPGVGWEPGAGNPNGNMTLFDFHGAGLPALAAFRPPRR
jgi:arabinogalactan endo-1,4-beta-galactosidase